MSSLSGVPGLQGLCKVLCDVVAQELGALDLHRGAVDVQWCVDMLGSSKVNNNLFCFVHIEGQVVGGAPVSELFHLLSVRDLVVSTDQPHHGCVISELDVI